MNVPFNICALVTLVKNEGKETVKFRTDLVKMLSTKGVTANVDSDSNVTFETVKLFKGIEEANIQPLLSCLCAKSIRFEKGQTVFSSGESIEQFGVVLSGQVQVVQDDYYGKRSILAKIDTGSLFGESFACAETKTLPVSVITTTESELLFIDCHRLLRSSTNSGSTSTQLT